MQETEQMEIIIDARMYEKALAVQQQKSERKRSFQILCILVGLVCACIYIAKSSLFDYNLAELTAENDRNLNSNVLSPLDPQILSREASLESAADYESDGDQRTQVRQCAIPSTPVMGIPITRHAMVDEQREEYLNDYLPPQGSLEANPIPYQKRMPICEGQWIAFPAGTHVKTYQFQERVQLPPYGALYYHFVPINGIDWFVPINEC